MKTRLMITSAMTPAEQRVGRYMRAPDAHPDGGVAVAEPPTPVEEAAPAAPPAKSTDDLYDEEFGGGSDEDGDDEDGGEGDEEDNEEDEDEAAEPVKEPPVKQPAPVEERIGELTAELRETQRQLAEEKRLREDAAKPKDTPAEEAKKAPDPADYEFGEADAKFIAASARWHADQRFDERQEMADREAMIAEIETGWKGAISEPSVAEQYPDFEEKVTKGADRKDWACTPVMAVLIKRSDVGVHVAYDLASNADESRRIAALSPEQQLYEIGRIEGRVSAALTAKGAEPAPKRATNAPSPPEARSRGAGGKFATDGDALYDKMLREFD